MIVSDYLTIERNMVASRFLRNSLIAQTGPRNLSATLFLLVSLLLVSFSAFSSDINKILVITLDDKIINPVTAEYIQEAIDRAEQEGDEALVIQLDTPGGLLSSTRIIVKRILNAEVPIVVYVAPSGSRAGSAGVFITLASHIAAMAPSTNIGAAHPVEFGESPRKKDESLKELLKSLKKGKENPSPLSGRGGGGGGEGGEGETDPMSDKILNDTVAWVTTIAKTRGRNVDWAVKTVRESLSQGETEALQVGAIDFIAKDLEELLKKLEGREVQLASGKKVTLRLSGQSIVRIEMNWRQRVLDVLINPNIAYLLMMIGFYGLLFEVTHPGVWFPGVAGLICLILAFYAFQTLPTNYAGFALIFVALALFVAEAFVPSFGLLSLVGVTSLLLGSLFLIDSAADFMQISLGVMLPVIAATAFLFLFLVGLALKAKRQRSPVGPEGLIGQLVEVQEGNKVLVMGEIWDIDSDRPVPVGTKVKVAGIKGMKLKVTQ